VYLTDRDESRPADGIGGMPAIRCVPMQEVTDVARAAYYVTKTLKLLRDATRGMPPP